MSWKKTLLLAPRVVASLILLQTLLFKFGIGGQSYLMESQELFTHLMISLTGSAEFEAHARIFTGVMELITAILLLVPAIAWLGSVLGIGLMIGALLSHVFFIGISINSDGGQLMFMAVVVLICCCKILYDERASLPWRS